MSRRLIVIVDYGVGNLASVMGAVHRAGHRALVSRRPDTLASADLLILPGVGAYRAAMDSLRRHDLVEMIRHQVTGGKPLLGICLGMQLLAESSLENGYSDGLGLIPGTVEPHPAGLRHIGWNHLQVRPDISWVAGLDDDLFYFNHSYYFRASDRDQVAMAFHGGPFAAAVQRDHIVGVQFHPEKSQGAGDRLMTRLIEDMTA
ncbi:MAG: imidazole glycerol phosphate synthase subunit HisH [Pseudomonadota bacterium]